MSKRVKKEKRPVAKIDFKPYGAAIKAGRTKQKESRNSSPGRRRAKTFSLRLVGDIVLACVFHSGQEGIF